MKDDLQIAGMPRAFSDSRSARLRAAAFAALLLLPLGATRAATIDGFDELPQPTPLPAQATDIFAYRAAVSGNTAFVSDHGNNRVHVYTQDADGVWSHSQVINSPTSNSDAQFGRALALQGGRAIIGAYRASRPGGAGSYDGAAYIYERSTGSWSQTAELTQETDFGRCFGWSVSLDGDTALVGKITSPVAAVHSPADCSAATGTNGQGAAYLFRNSGGSWSREARLQPIDGSGAADGLVDGHFGFSVALSGDSIAVSSDHHDGGLGGTLHGEQGYHTGRVYLYRHNGAASWPLENRISGDNSGDHFGYAVALQDDTLLIGARRVEPASAQAEAGAAFIYQRQSGGTWQREQQIDPPDGGQVRGLFGNAVAISGGYALIGELQDDEGSFYDGLGEAHLYQIGVDGRWGHLTSAFTHPLAAGDKPARFAGNGLALSGRSLLVGADNAAGSSGTGRAFAYNLEPYSFAYSETQALQPQGYWPLDEPHGSKAWDASGWRRDGDHSGGALLGEDSYLEGGSAQFDGSDDQIDIDASFGGVGQATLSAWLYSAPGSSGVQIAVGASSADFLALGVDRGTGELLGRAYNGGSAEVRGSLPGEGWQHVAVVFDAGSLSLYINGVAGTPVASGLGTLSAASRLHIGRGPNGDYFPGYIDEVAVFHSALSTAQVLDLFNAPAQDALPLAVLPSAPDCAASCSEDTALVSGSANAVAGRNPSFDLLPGSVQVDGAAAADGLISVAALDGDWSYAPTNRTADYLVSFQLRITAGATTASALVSFSVLADNDAPNTSNVAASGAESDAQISGSISASDPENLSLSYRIEAGDEPAALTGSAGVDSAGNWQYQPANRSSSYVASFTVTVSDGVNNVPARVDVSVSASNAAPSVAASALTGDEDTALAVTPVITDVDVDDSHTLSIVSPASQGTASVSGSQLHYAPNANSNGGDSFTYRVRDAAGSPSAPVTATVTVVAVNDAPTATSASFAIDEDNLGTATPSVSDVDLGEGDSHSFSIVSQPAHGTASVNAGQLLYTPAADYNGADDFTFTATDSAGASVTGTASIGVAAVNDAPLLQTNGVNGLVLKVGQTIEASFSVIDPDTGDSHSFSALGSALDDGLGTLDGFASGLLRFTAVAEGQGALQIRVSDGLLDSAVFTLSVRVNAANVADANGDGLSDQQASANGLDPSSADSDGDGQSDVLELGDPESPADSDHDGVIDALEPAGSENSAATLGFVVNARSAATLNLTALAGQTLEITASGAALTAHNTGNGLPLGAAALAAADSGFDFPLGVFDFSVAGASATVVIRYPNTIDFPANAVLRKQDASGSWRTYPSSLVNIDAATRTVTLTLTDGDEWDRDLTDDMIRDPMGIAVARPVSTGGGGAVGGLLGLLAALGWRRRQAR